MRLRDRLFANPKFRKRFLVVMALAFAAALFLRPVLGGDPAPATGQPGVEHHFKFFALFSDPAYTSVEIYSLLAVLGIAIAGLLYAWMLVGQVMRADRGTPRMQEIAAAVREGANAYLAAQFRKIGPLIVIITVLLSVTYTRQRERIPLRPRRRVPDRLAVQLGGRLRRHAAGHRGQPPRGRRRHAQLRRGPAARLPHRHDHRHVDRRPGPAGRHDASS